MTSDHVQQSRARPGRFWLGAELAVLFALGPMIYVAVSPGTGVLFPALWAWAIFALVMLFRDRSFSRRELWNAAGLRGAWWPMLARFAVLGGLLTLVVWAVTPEHLFDLPRRNPWLWLAIMVFYPLLSVYPQEVIFRAFLFQRYRPLVGGGAAMVLLSAAVFGWVHIVFEHWISVALTVIGGLLFARTFVQTRSVAAASLEHSLYGCLIFTIGLNTYFYSGSVGT